MLLKSIKTVILLLATLYSCECVFYSSFWAPLFDRRVLNYQVDVEFNPGSGKRDMADFQRKFGYRGKILIADLGNGKKLTDLPKEDMKYEDVNFYYT